MFDNNEDASEQAPKPYSNLLIDLYKVYKPIKRVQ